MSASALGRAWINWRANPVLTQSRLPYLMGQVLARGAGVVGTLCRQRHQISSGTGTHGLRIVADVNTFPPTTYAGSERSLQATLRNLGKRGYRVLVLVPPSQECVSEVGIDVICPRSLRERLDLYAVADVVMTQLEAYERALLLARFMGKPLVHFSRMGYFNQLAHLGTPDLIVYNCAWAPREFPPPVPHCVVHSPVDVEQFRVSTTRRYLTMINLNHRKGGDFLGPLARALPDREFMAVLGSQGKQIIPSPLPRNVRVCKNTPNILEVYAETDVLVFPTRYDPHPRVGLEAAASGIPTIATPIKGNLEAMGPAAIYARFGDVDGWASSVRALERPDYYSALSRFATDWAKMKANSAEMDHLDSALRQLVRDRAGH